MPSTASIESTSYTLKLNANSQKVFNCITNWTKISNASRNQMPVAAQTWPSSGDSVAVWIRGIGIKVAAVRYRDVADCFHELESAVDVVVEPTIGMPWFLYRWECILASLLVEWSCTVEPADVCLAVNRRHRRWRWPKKVNMFGCDTLILRRNAAWKLSKELLCMMGCHACTDNLESPAVDLLIHCRST